MTSLTWSPTQLPATEQGSSSDRASNFRSGSATFESRLRHRLSGLKIFRGFSLDLGKFWDRVVICVYSFLPRSFQIVIHCLISRWIQTLVLYTVSPLLTDDVS